MQVGIIIKTFGRYYNILNEADYKTIYLATLRGKLRLEDRRSTKLIHQELSKTYYKNRHLLTIGDRVNFEIDKSNKETAVIHSVLKPKNILERSYKGFIHYVGANIDTAIILSSLENPAPHFGFIDRFLCSCLVSEITPEILFTKIDLIKDIDHFFPIIFYKSLGYKVNVINLLNINELEFYKKYIRDKNTILIGNSGVGKSTFVNLFLKKNIQKISVVSNQSGQGKHTTTNASLFWNLSNNKFIIDTPGLREWGLEHLNLNDIFCSFCEISPLIKNCIYSDCKHEKESKGCAIIPYLKESKNIKTIDNKEEWNSKIKMHPSRLRSFESILIDNGFKNYIKQYETINRK